MTALPVDPEAFKAFERAGWEEIDPAAYDATTGTVTVQAAAPLLDAVRRRWARPSAGSRGRHAQRQP